MRTTLTEDDVKVTIHRDGTFSVRLPIGQLGAVDHAFFRLYSHWTDCASRGGDMVRIDRDLRDEAFAMWSAVDNAKKRYQNRFK